MAVPPGWNDQVANVRKEYRDCLREAQLLLSDAQRSEIYSRLEIWREKFDYALGMGRPLEAVVEELHDIADTLDTLPQAGR
jgi:hypothetical protein